MTWKPSIPSIARAVILILFCLSVWRAATLSITADEAYTFERSVMTPIPELWKVFDANDHVLHTLLCKVTVGWFGASELTLRMPALAGGLLLLWAAMRVSFFVFGEGLYGLLVFLLIALNPFVFDYCSLARGYGLALAFFLVAMDQLLRYLERPYTPWRLYMAGVSLALSVAANLTLVIGGVALVAGFAVVHWGEPLWRRQWSRVKARVGMVCDQLVVPGVVTSVVILVMPLMNISREALYVGASSLDDAAKNLWWSILWRPKNVFEGGPLHLLMEAVVTDGALLFVGLILAAGILAVVLQRRRLGPDVVLVMAALVAVGLIVLLHAAFGTPYPYRRTGLYVVPLLTLVAGVAVRGMRRFGTVIGVLFLAWLLGNWDLRYYDEWLHDAGNRELMQYVRSLRPADGSKRSIAATFPLGHSVVFYKRIYGMDWLEVPDPHEGADRDADIYLLTKEDKGVVEKRGLVVRQRNGVAESLVATSRVLE